MLIEPVIFVILRRINEDITFNIDIFIGDAFGID